MASLSVSAQCWICTKIAPENAEGFLFVADVGGDSWEPLCEKCADILDRLQTFPNIAAKVWRR